MIREHGHPRTTSDAIEPVVDVAFRDIDHDGNWNENNAQTIQIVMKVSEG